MCYRLAPWSWMTLKRITPYTTNSCLDNGVLNRMHWVDTRSIERISCYSTDYRYGQFIWHKNNNVMVNCYSVRCQFATSLIISVLVNSTRLHTFTTCAKYIQQNIVNRPNCRKLPEIAVFIMLLLSDTLFFSFDSRTEGFCPVNCVQIACMH